MKQSIFRFPLAICVVSYAVSSAVIQDEDPLATWLEATNNDIAVNSTETNLTASDLVVNPVTTPTSAFTLAEPTTTQETEPDDYLNWFFYHSFKKLDQFFQKEDEKEMRSISGDDPNQKSNWKVRVSKVILKLVLVILALVGSILFIVGVFFVMILSFLILKFFAHTLQCCQERQKYKNNSTTYQVNA